MGKRQDTLLKNALKSPYFLPFAPENPYFLEEKFLIFSLSFNTK